MTIQPGPPLWSIRLRLRSRVGNPSSAQFFAPPELVFQLRDNDVSRLAVPDDPQFGFLGPPGTTIRIAPETRLPSLLFAGWETERILPGQLRGDAVGISLVEVAGPGPVEMFGSPHTLTARYAPRFSNDHATSTSAPVTAQVQGGGTPTSSPTTPPPSAGGPDPARPAPGGRRRGAGPRGPARADRGGPVRTGE